MQVLELISEYCPYEQFKHGDEPFVLLNVPAGQAVHFDPIGVNPELQRQNDLLRLSGFEYENVWQSLQNEEPGESAYLPPSHAKHPDDAFELENRPNEQFMQGEEPI